jgi:RNA polymerase sigma-70 factor (ECF subfamily)
VLAALRDAFARLPREQRNVLRLHHAGGLPGDRIAALLGKSRATVVRWLTAARESMLREVHAILQERLAADAAEVDSLIALVRSRLDVSLSALLRDSGE